jgi:hypothetical protein
MTEDEKLAVKDYMKDPSVVLLTKLKCITSGIEVTVGNIHVAYAFYKHPDLQCVQVRICDLVWQKEALILKMSCLYGPILHNIIFKIMYDT